ncbi:MAG: phosphoglycerate dehydrogenase [Clostridiales bacterium]|nr:phosphoglycerate dehydrogenase [Clostridiales bacterium]
MKILLPEKIAESGIELLRKDFEVDEKYNLSPEALLECIGEYDALIVRSATKVTSEVIEKGSKLKVIGRAGTGVDNIDVETATRKGIIVVNTPESNNISTAEHTIALMLALARNIPQAYSTLKNGKWMRSKFKGVELYNKTVVILGLGRIGSNVANRLKSFGMNVMGYDPYVNDDRFDRLGVQRITSIEEAMRVADFITVHLPKTQETMGIIGERELSMAKPNLRIINCARGGLVDEEALYNALKSGKIAGAAIDVFKAEPKESAGGTDFSHKLLELDNVIFTPHLGASTQEAQENVGIDIAKQVSEALKGNIVNAVNLHGLNVQNMTALAPYLKMARILGKMYYSAEKFPVQKVELIYSGDITNKETKLVTLSYLSGLLDPIMEERVNFVNVGMMIKERGIEVIESKRSDVDHYTNLVTVKVTNRKKAVTFAGTVFGKDEIRIVNFGGYEVDFEPTPYMLIIQNYDRPGVIGRIGTILGEANVNIATMRVSQNRREGKALMVLNIDHDVSPETIKRIEEVDNILKVSLIKL